MEKKLKIVLIILLIPAAVAVAFFGMLISFWLNLNADTPHYVYEIIKSETSPNGRYQVTVFLE